MEDEERVLSENDADGREANSLVTPKILPQYLHNNSPVNDSGDAGLALPCDFSTETLGGENGVCGLHNLGNTCFMNAGLQCLVSNPLLGRFFLEEFSYNDLPDVTVVSSFYKLFHQMWSGNRIAVHPREFKDCLSCHHPQFKDFRQHDCQEFLALLLDSLHEQLNEVRGDSPGKSACLLQLQEHSSKPNSDLSVIEPRNTVEEQASSFLTDQMSSSQDTAYISNVQQTDGEAATDGNITMSNVVNEVSDQIHTTGNIQLEFPIGTTECAILSDAAPDSDMHAQPMELSPVQRSGLVSPSSSAFCEREGKPEEVLCGQESESNSTKLSSSLETAQQKKAYDESFSSSPPSMDESAPCDPEVKKLPSLEDLYMKDLKVKNTNVISNLLDEDKVATDSEKFVKCDNVDVSQQVNEEFSHVEHLSDLLGYEVGTTSSGKDCCKPFKETNLLANITDKFTGTHFTKKCLFSDLSPEVDEYSINNIKRMKIDEEEEKNIKMQAKCKVNLDRNVTQEALNIALSGSVEGHSGEGPVAAGPSSPGSRYRLYNNEEQVRRKHLAEAKMGWNRYLKNNQSAIVDAFHGQFKSTVVCSECHHVSVTFEPFMYLSVPLPHAMEKQISILFIACDKQPIRYLVTVNKNDCIKNVKQSLRSMIGEESCDVIIAEVFENHIARILDDNMMLKFLNDTDRDVYAFEMIPCPEEEDSTAENTTASQITNNAQHTLPNNSLNPSSSPLANNTSPKQIQSTAINDLTDISDSDKTQLNNSSLLDDSMSSAQQLELHPEVNWQHNLLGEDGPQHSYTQEDPAGSSASKNFNLTAGEEGEGAGTTDDWKSCAICLEDMIDSDLMVHKSCGGTLCQTCLDMTFKHYGDTAFQCPVCSCSVDPGQEFIPLNCMADYKPKTRILSMSIMHRLDSPSDGSAEDAAGNESSKGSMQLFGHPNILYLPSTLSGETLYENVDRVVSSPGSYTILLTDGQGYHCARCPYTSHCRGCVVPHDGQVSLQPGDHLTVCFTSLSPSHLLSAKDYLNHSSMALKRSDEPLTIYDCLHAFTQSETLDEHNPWFCPVCTQNQCAHKTMTVWRYPDTLVVYLKRFVFHNLSGSKIESKVVFPLTNLDLSRYISGPHNNRLLYDLQGCICHVGGVSSGHYTAYTKHPLTNQWHFFNDETVTKQQPTEQDFSNAYILFYQRHGTNVDFHVPESTNEKPEENFSFVETMYHPVPSHYPTDTSQDELMNNDQNADDKMIDDCNNYDFYS